MLLYTLKILHTINFYPNAHSFFSVCIGDNLMYSKHFHFYNITSTCMCVYVTESKQKLLKEFQLHVSIAVTHTSYSVFGELI